MTKGKTIIKGAIILTAANLSTRVMGFVYRIFMSKAIGAKGMGVYQLIIPVYLLVFSLCSSGFATAVSNCTSAYAAKSGSTRRLLNTALAAAVNLSLAACLLVFFGAGFIGRSILREPRTVLSLKIIALCFPFMSAGACLRGYFYGMQKMSVPAAAQVCEQCIRILTVWLLYGGMRSRGLEYACAAAVMGMAGGEIVSFILTLAACRLSALRPRGTADISRSAALTEVFSRAVPLTLNRGISSCLSAAENALIPQRLRLFGLSREEALGIFGGLCGMAAPLVMFPCSLLTALATALMPAISECSAKGEYKTVAQLLKKSLLFTSVIGIGCCGIFAVFPAEISAAVYGRNDISAMLRLLGFVCPFLYTQVIFSAALNGLDCQMFIFKTGILSSIISIASIYFLMPRFGLHAYIAGWAVSAVTANAFSAVKLESIAGRFALSPAVYIKCVLAITAVCLCAKRISRHFPPTGLCGMFILVGVCAACYLAALRLLGVTEDPFLTAYISK